MVGATSADGDRDVGEDGFDVPEGGRDVGEDGFDVPEGGRDVNGGWPRRR
jgi:hypothetical protein